MRSRGGAGCTKSCAVPDVESVVSAVHRGKRQDELTMTALIALEVRETVMNTGMAGGAPHQLRPARRMVGDLQQPDAPRVDYNERMAVASATTQTVGSSRGRPTNAGRNRSLSLRDITEDLRDAWSGSTRDADGFASSELRVAQSIMFLARSVFLVRPKKTFWRLRL